MLQRDLAQRDLGDFGEGHGFAAASNGLAAAGAFVAFGAASRRKDWFPSPMMRSPSRARKSSTSLIKPEAGRIRHPPHEAVRPNSRGMVIQHRHPRLYARLDK